MKFFKTVFATMLGTFLMSILLVFVAVIIIAGMVSAGEDKVPEVKDNTILQLTLNQEITDRTSDNPFANFDYMSMDSKKSLGLFDILQSIEKAQNDDRIKGAFIDLSGIQAGWATTQEIRNALLDFKASGKFILAYADAYGQKGYYLASVADNVYLQPEGGIDFIGMSAQVMYYKNALAKLGIEPEVIRHGKFKAAVEPFLIDEMSEANHEQISRYIGNIWTSALTDIGEARGITVEDLNYMADSLLITSAQAAVDYKLIDSLKYRDQVIDELKTLAGIDLDKDLKTISLAKYTKVPRIKHDSLPKGLAKDKIAIVFATGEIGMGKGDDKTIGSTGLSEALIAARDDKNVKAVVLRINSPGGSALASDIIWREIELLKKEKPVIVSMGDVAASGGYYIACNADTIIANPNTLTGSIGVFGLLFNAEQLITEKFGLHVETVNTNTYADLGTFARKMTVKERNSIQKMIENIYGTFIGHVGEGRGMSTADVDSIGQGRIWTGNDASQIGLVDIEGGLNKAIEVAVEKAELDNYRIISLPKKKDPMAMIMESLEMSVSTYFIEQELPYTAKYLKYIKQINNLKGAQTRLPFMMEIE